MMLQIMASLQRAHLGMFLDYYAAGGIESQTVALANELVRHNTCKVTLLVAGEFEQFIKRFTLDDAITLMHINQPGWQLLSTFYKAKRFDALLMSQLFDSSQRVWALKLSSSGLRVIMQVHWQAISQRFQTFEIMQAYKKVWAVVALSRVDQRYLNEHAGARAFYIPNIVNINESRESHPIQSHQVLFLGRYHIEKRPDLALEAARLVLEQIPEARVVFAGFVQDRVLFDAMQSRIASEGRNEIRLLPDQQDVFKLISQSVVVLQTSPSEGFALSSAEAVLQKVPVCAFRILGLETQRNAAVRTAPFGDVAGLASCAVSLLASADERRRLGSRGREEIAGMFSVHKVVEMWRDLLDDVLEPYDVPDLPYEAALFEAQQNVGLCPSQD